MSYDKQKADLEDICKFCKEIIHLDGTLWKDDGILFPQYCRASYGGQLHARSDLGNNRPDAT